jgi:hypothetical protein
MHGPRLVARDEHVDDADQRPADERAAAGAGYDLSYILGPRGGSRLVGRRSAWGAAGRPERRELPPGGGYVPDASPWNRHPPIGLPDDPSRELPPSGGAARPRVERPLVPGERRFRDGDRVRHRAFGEGSVVTSRLTRDDEEVTVAFPERGVKKLLASIADLELVG